MAGVDLPRPNGDDDPLAQPTRRRLFVLLSASGRATSTDELAGDLGLHPNGVRTHLQRMRNAGLVVHRRVAGARGRPHDEWAVAPDDRPGGDPPDAYATLARWLARTIPATTRRLREVEQTGQAIGQEFADHGAAPPDQAIIDLLAALGFKPEVRDRSDGRLSCRLRNCPYRESVRENRDVVCTLHRGLTRGFLDQVAPTARLTRFIPHDPDRAGCEVDIEGLAHAAGR